LTIPEIASSHAAEPIGRGPISIRRSATVLRVVLPLRWPVAPADSTRTPNTTPASDATHSSSSADAANTPDTAHTADSTDAANAAHTPDASNTANPAARSANVAVSSEVVVIVYVDGVVAAPSASITPPSTPEGAHSYAHSKRNRQSGSIVSGIVIGIRVDRWSPHVNGVITRHVNDLGVGLLDDHDALLLNYFGFDLDLLVGG